MKDITKTISAFAVAGFVAYATISAERSSESAFHDMKLAGVLPEAVTVMPFACRWGVGEKTVVRYPEDNDGVINWVYVCRTLATGTTSIEFRSKWTNPVIP